MRWLDAWLGVSWASACSQEQVTSDQLVPGDIVCLDEGVLVPADLRFLSVSQLHVIEGVLTGTLPPFTLLRVCV